MFNNIPIWKIITSILGILGTMGSFAYGFFKHRTKAKIESFHSVMEESRKFRDEIRTELNEAHKKINQLEEQVNKYFSRIKELESKLEDALKERSWLYYYLQKPLQHSEIEIIINRHVLSKRDKILVVDDDPYTVKVFESFSKDWNITHVQSGQKVLEYIKLHTPKLVFIDLVLPVSEGFEIINAIHQNKDLVNVPMVIISPNNLKKMDRTFLHNKINESLTKAK